MNNLGNSLSKFFKNKNTVTILGVIVGLAVLFFGYNYQINQQVKKVKVLVATQDIQPRTKITESMVETVEIAQEMYSKMSRDMNSGSVVLTNKLQVSNLFTNGAYSNINTTIPKGVPLIKGVNIVDKDLIKSNIYEKVEGKIPYAFRVDSNDTYGNSILDGMYIDIYMKATDDSGKLMVGKLLSNVKVVSVLDASGKNVFENTEENRTASYFLFGLDNDTHIFLRKAAYLSVSLFVVPVVESATNEDYKGTTTILENELYDYIINKTKDVKEIDLPDETSNIVEKDTENE